METVVQLLVKGSIIGLMLLVSNVIYVFFPDQSFLAKCLSLINSAMNPLLYILFNGTVRRQLARQCCRLNVAVSQLRLRVRVSHSGQRLTSGPIFGPGPDPVGENLDPDPTRPGENFVGPDPDPTRSNSGPGPDPDPKILRKSDPDPTRPDLNFFLPDPIGPGRKILGPGWTRFAKNVDPIRPGTTKKCFKMVLNIR